MMLSAWASAVRKVGKNPCPLAAYSLLEEDRNKQLRKQNIECGRWQRVLLGKIRL